MVFVNHWYILWSQIKFYVTLFHFTWGRVSSRLMSWKRDNSTEGILDRLGGTVWQIKKISLFVDLYKHNMKLVILLQLLKLVSRSICKEEQIT